MTFDRSAIAARVEAMPMPAWFGTSAFRRVATIFGLVALATAAVVGALHPFAPAGATPTAAPSGALGAGSVWQGGSTLGFDAVDLSIKCAIVIALLYVCLRVLGRMQGNAIRKSGRLEVLESRPLAAKASLHLIAVGERRLVVGLTPAGMVSLAELDASELEPEEPVRGESDSDFSRPTPASTASPDPLFGRFAALLGGRAR